MPKHDCPKIATLLKSLKSTKVSFDLGFSQYSRDKELFTRDQLKALRDKIKDQIKEIETLIHPAIISLSPEGKEIKIEINERMEYWNDFYNRHNIKDTQGNLARVDLKDLKFTSHQIEQISIDAKREKYQAAILIPENVSITEIEEALKKALIAKGKATPEDEKIYFDSDINQANFHKLSTGDKPYLFLHQDTPETPKINPEGDTADELQQEFSKHPNKTGFGPIEYLLALIDHLERLGELMDSKTWTWLPKTYEKQEKKGPGSLSRRSSSSCLIAGWNPVYRRVDFDEHDSDYRGSGRGGRPASSFAP